jgi:pyruvate formate-lyase activating enzyme-like uncharacterized protein
MGVNYCNFQFKNRFQKAGFRRKMATCLAEAGEEVTENGFLRRIIAETGGVEAEVRLGTLNAMPSLPDQITLHYKGRVLENLRQPTSGRSYLIEGIEYPIEEGLSIEPVLLQGRLVADYLEMMSHDGSHVPRRQRLFQAWQQEFIETGLGEYF